VIARKQGSLISSSPVVFLSAAVLLAGCAVGPNYHRPAVAVPDRWPTPPNTAAVIGPATEQWWESFGDRELNSLVTRAVEANLDLKLAAARVEEARANRGVARSGGLPQLTGTMTASRQRQIAQGFVPNESGTGASLQTFPYETNLFSGLVDMSWEIDLFGGIRRQVQAAEADLTAQKEDRRNVLISLLGDAATNYAQVRGYQMRLDIARHNIGIQKDTLKLTRDLVNAGQATERDVAQSEALLETTRASLSALDSGLQTAIHRLGVLLGLEPGALASELAASAPLPLTPPEVPVGLPSDLLKRRPDIRRAEAQLVAATARVGQAKADYFPKLSLTGSAGREATELRALTLSLANVFSIGPSISLPIFTGGKIRSNVAAQTARMKQAEVTYESTILTALEETENALVNLNNEQERRNRLQEVVRASQTALELAQIQYKAGLTDFLTVLESERTLAGDQDQLAQSQVSATTNLISLYKALGGGWDIPR
jgi:NodT family efflux transporter outer membrane factor (OMF) lipoprotein